MGELIYSERYQDDFMNNIEFEVPIAEERKFSPDEISAIMKKLQYDLENNSTYEPIPGKEKTVKRAIEIAKFISGHFKIDTDIIKNIDGYEIILYIKQMPIVSVIKKSYATLFSIADEAYIQSDKETEYDHKCHFTIKTHKHYINGREMGFYND